ncbi:putative hexaprenyl pyrophosphate synthetase Coq1 [Elsinoe ampelina]|uniref:Putative hexaprenyl pyrophosphate synthetase Coq1 n=1 Tax=Elsinoe ampelina TaxID=302913 RepID=A0A6A6GQ07_9PEZI|nr:putative hexaprenyl pyrophosphate synthetase Coq1 [Elsinoe ampelina]
MSVSRARASTLVASIAARRPQPRSPLRCPGCSQPLALASPQSPSTSLYHPPRRRHQSAVAAAVSAAKTLFSNDAPPPPMGIDPLRGVAKELKSLAGNLKQLLGSGHPMLDTVAKYYTSSEGKYVRPMLVLLMSQATALTPQAPRHTYDTRKEGVNTPFTSASILSDTNPTSPLTAPLDNTPDPANPDILPSQRRLAEITELIHTASLLHDDVIDHSTSRRGFPSANTEFGNKMAVLAGDFLLGRASVALARLRDPEVTELLATVIANLVEGEFMQLRNTAQDEKHPTYSEETLGYYLQKTYLKSASLISKSCRAAALLGGRSEETVEAAYQYGKNLGLAFQLVDDMLDYTVDQGELGKPAGADLKLGLATAPLLFAWRENRALGELVGRKFSREGDVEKARQIVLNSDGLAQTRALAQDFVERAKAAIAHFPDSDAKTGLVDMCSKVMNRRK